MWSFLENFFENKARIKIERFNQLPPLHKAIKDDNVSNVRIYLHRGCDVNEQDIYGKTPLHHACERNNKEIIILLLQSSKIMINVKDNTGYTPLDLLLTLNLKNEIHIENNIDTSKNDVGKLGETLSHESSSD